MTTTIEPEGDPTFLAYERARQYGESTLAPRAGVEQARLAGDVQRGQVGLALDQEIAVEDNLNSYRASGFGQSGLRAKDEGRIRADIALRVGELLSGYNRDSSSVTDSMLDDLASLGMASQEEQNAARNRMTKIQAQSGVGI